MSHSQDESDLEGAPADQRPASARPTPPKLTPQQEIQRQLDEALAASFPASDPVSIVTSHAEEDWGMDAGTPALPGTAALPRAPAEPATGAGPKRG